MLSFLLSYGELVSTAGVEPAASGFVDRHLDPFGHVDIVTAAPPAGFAPATSALTGRRYYWLSYGGRVRALGLEPSLIRGRSPVPYQSGVTRIGGPGGTRTPSVGKTAGLQPAAPHGATDPVAGPDGAGPDDDASAVVKMLFAGLDARHAHARTDSNPQPAVLETAAPPRLERMKEMARMTWCAMWRETRQRAKEPELPASAGRAGIGSIPTSQPMLLIEP